MLDDDARRALEEEAIALVSLSRPAGLRFAAQQDAHRQLSGSTATTNNSNASNGQQPPRPLLQTDKTRGGRRDSVKREPNASATSAAAASHGADESARLSAKDTTATLRLQPHHSELLCAQSPEQAHPDTQTRDQLDSGSISMKSLLVTLKKRKLSPAPNDDAAESERLAKVLPSFRDVFEPPRQPSQAGEASSHPEEPLAAVATTADSASSSATATDLKYKCKYRTGKCSNVRALKSCGDYHNLCNYHRLRANANQRKLDRKKKVQRLQVVPAGVLAAMAAVAAAAESAPVSAAPASTTTGAAASTSSSSSSPASVASALLCAPSVAAAVALVAMPSSAPKPRTHAEGASRAEQPPPQEQRM